MTSKADKKTAIRGWTIISIITVAFSAIVFAVPFHRTSVFWVAYLSGVIAILFQVYIFVSSFSSSDDARSKFYGFPIARLGVYYLLAQLSISIVEIVLANIIPLWLVLLVNVVLLAFALIGCITAETMRDEIVRQDKQIKESISKMRELQSFSASIANQCYDKKLKSIVDKIAEDFRYSDPVTSEKTFELESDMLEELKTVQQAVVDGDVDAAEKLSSKLLASLAERNRICSISK